MENKQLGKNVLFNTVGSLTFFACQYLTTFLVVRLGGWADAGLLATAMNISNVCLSFASYGMRSYQVSDFARKYSDRVYLASRWLTLAAAGLGCLVFSLANSYSALQRSIIFAYTFCRLLESFVDVWHGYLQRAERMDLVGVSFGVRGLLSLGGFAAGLVLAHSLLVSVLAMALLSLGFLLAFDLPLARRRADFAPAASGRVGSLLWECAPLAVYAFLNSGVGAVPKYFCERLLGTEAMGYFNSVFAPVQILQVGAAYLFVPFITVFARYWAEKNGAKFRRGFGLVLAALLALWGCGAAGVALLGRWGLSLLYGPAVLDYAGLLQPLVVSTVITTLVLVLCHLLTVMREMRGLIVGNLAGIAVSAAASLLLTEPLGVYGTAFATIAACTAQSLVMLGFFAARCKKQFG